MDITRLPILVDRVNDPIVMKGIEQFAWARGKTAASTSFIIHAGHHIASCQDKVIVELLMAEIERIMSDDVSLSEFRTIEAFIASAKIS